MVQIVESSGSFDDVLNNNNLVFVDFFADWCGPCRAIAPVLEKFEQEIIEQRGENGPGVKFIKVNVDTNTQLAIKYGISAMPTFIMFKDGERAKSLVGANTEGIRRMVLEFLNEADQSNETTEKNSPPSVEEEEVEVVA